MENLIWTKTLFYLCILLRQNEATELGTSEKLQICPGEMQNLMCSANYTFLEWNITTISLSLPSRTIVPYEDLTLSLTPITINSAKFTFSRDSSPRTLPLVSTLTIENVTSNLEGTVVACTGINSSLSTVVLMKSIHVFDVKTDFPDPPEIVTRTDMILFGNDNFTVTLEWSQISGETYTVATTPEPEHTNFTKSTTVQMVMLYNIQYNVNVTATDTLCGHRNTANLNIHYATCDSLPADTTSLTVISGHVPVLQGQNITFICFRNESQQLSICGESGRWDPDPKEVCKINYHSDNDSRPRSTMTDSPLLGYLVGVPIIIIISLISVTVITVTIIIAIKRRGRLQYFKKALETPNDLFISQNLTSSRESEVIHEMVHNKADQSGALIYADVFSSSSILPKLPSNQTSTLDDDRVNYAEVNHNLRPHNNNSEVDSLLNLDNLLIQIKQDTTQVWYQLGEALGIEKKILEKFTTCSPEESIIEMLDYWLRHHAGRPTWKEVAEALRKIHLHKSASGIDMIYKTGELTVAVDLDLNQVSQELIKTEAADDCGSPPPIPPKGT